MSVSAHLARLISSGVLRADASQARAARVLDGVFEQALRWPETVSTFQGRGVTGSEIGDDTTGSSKGKQSKSAVEASANGFLGTSVSDSEGKAGNALSTGLQHSMELRIPKGVFLHGRCVDSSSSRAIQ